MLSDRAEIAGLHAPTVRSCPILIKYFGCGCAESRLARAAAWKVDMRSIGILTVLLISALTPLAANPILLGDISYQPDAPLAGLTSIFLDNFTDLADLGCSTTFPACGGISISGLLSVTYEDSKGNTHNSSISVSSTGPGSTSIYEFNPAQIMFESAILTGTISPATFRLDTGKTFISTGTFVSETLTPDIGFANISVSGSAPVQEAAAVPEPDTYSLIVAGLLALGACMACRRSE
jgi:hypothetical protein